MESENKSVSGEFQEQMQNPEKVKEQIEALEGLINSESGWTEGVKRKLEEAREELKNHLKTLEEK